MPLDLPMDDVSELPLAAAVTLNGLSAHISEPLDVEAMLTALRPIFEQAREVAERAEAQAAARVGALIARIHDLEAKAEKDHAYIIRLYKAIEDTIAEGLAVQAETIRDGFNPFGYFVYLLWGDDDERPAYVGKSTNVLARLGTHVIDFEKSRHIRRVTLLRCKTEHQMTKTEGRLIARYQPPLNIVGVRKTA